MMEAALIVFGTAWALIALFGVIYGILVLSVEMSVVKEAGYATKERREEIRAAWNFIFGSIFLPALVPIVVFLALKQLVRSLKLAYGRSQIEES